MSNDHCITTVVGQITHLCSCGFNEGVLMNKFLADLILNHIQSAVVNGWLEYSRKKPNFQSNVTWSGVLEPLFIVWSANGVN